MKQYSLYLVHREPNGIDCRSYHGSIIGAEELVVLKLKNPHIKYTEVAIEESDPLPLAGSIFMDINSPHKK
jgi:hypothetical protein